MPFDILVLVVRISITINIVLVALIIAKVIYDRKRTGELHLTSDDLGEEGKVPIQLIFHFDPFEARDGDTAVFTIHRN